MTTTPNPDQADRVSRARLRLVLEAPFFGTLALRLRLVQSPAVGTAATDGQSLWYAPAFVAGLTDAQLQGLLAHEVMHCALLHQFRRGEREPGRWNHACDHAINPLLIDAGYALPADGLSVAGAQFPGQSAEEIYAQLPPPPPGGGDGQSEGADGAGGGAGQAGDPGPGDYGPGGVLDAPGGGAERAEAEADWRAAVQVAAQQAKAQGRLPAGLEQALDLAQAPLVDWRALLRQFVERVAGRQDYTWRMPNSRYAHLGVYLPALDGEQCAPLAVMVDTSGSISPDELGQFAAEITAIAEDLQPAALAVLWADATVCRVDQYGPGESPDFSAGAPGGGGTDFRPAFDWLAAQPAAPACAVYLTDGYGAFPQQAPAYPVLWVMTTDAPAPWGQVVRMDLAREGRG